MGLVDDDCVVGAEAAVAPKLGEQDAIGHELDEGLVGEAAREAVLEADGSADILVEFGGYTARHLHSGEAAWLRAGD